MNIVLISVTMHNIYLRSKEFFISLRRTENYSAFMKTGDNPYLLCPNNVNHLQLSTRKLYVFYL